MTPFHPDSWMDVFVLLTLAVISSVPSWAALRNHRSLQQVKDQVVNGHKTAMRADMDAMRDELGGMRDEMRGGFAAVRGDISEERLARRTGDDSIHDEIARRHPPT